MDILMAKSVQKPPQEGEWGWRRTALWVSVFVSFLLPALPANSQGLGPRTRWRPVEARQRAGSEAQRPGFFQRLRDLPPKEQERVLANDKRFQSLPPERQEKIRENLQRWNNLPPERKDQLREREAIFSSLTPAQRQEARGIFLEWRELRPIERRKIMRAFRYMRNLPPGERQRFLDSPQVRDRFSPNERTLLERLGHLLPESAPKEDTSDRP
jgi:hypothetical protein